MKTILINTDDFLAMQCVYDGLSCEDFDRIVESKSIMITIKKDKQGNYRINFTLFEQDKK